jgi:hypothetical protein
MYASCALRSRVLFAVGLIGIVSTVPALANDGGIAFGGSPSLLKNHPSVRMTSEVIRITVDSNTLTADCRFVFTNSGAACKARMGFPDQGVGASDPDEENADDTMNTPPRTTFNTFSSWVDGKKVPTKLIRANEEGEYWHTKTVQFPAHKTVLVRDVYTQHVGGGLVSIPNRNCLAAQIGYILHTGASWHGTIGRSEVIVTFRDPKLPHTLKPVPLAQVSKSSDGRYVCSAMPSGDAVVWSGPCKPIVTGRTLRFVRENWRPTRSSDIQLTFGYTEIKDQTEKQHAAKVTAVAAKTLH